MARYNEILVGRLNRGLQKWSGIKGEPPAPQLSSEIQASVTLFRGIEERYLDGYDLFGNAAVVNVAAQTSAQRLRNPVGSGVIGVITSIVITVGANMQAQVSVILSPSAGFVDENFLGQGINLDFRGRPKSTLVYSTNTAAPAATTGAQAFWIASPLIANTPVQVILMTDQQIPVLPGTCILINSATAATGLAVGMSWRERVIEDSEKT